MQICHFQHASHDGDQLPTCTCSLLIFHTPFTLWGPAAHLLAAEVPHPVHTAEGLLQWEQPQLAILDQRA